MGRNQEAWSMEMHDFFMPLFTSGMSYGNIALKMTKQFPRHPLTKASISGHVFRNGLSRSAKLPREKKQIKKHTQRPTSVNVKEIRRVRKAQRDKQKSELGLDDAAPVARSLLDAAVWRAPLERTIGLSELNEDSCRWPLTVDGCFETRYCANVRAHGPYCLAHGDIGGNGFRVKIDPDHKKDHAPAASGNTQWR